MVSLAVFPVEGDLRLGLLRLSRVLVLLTWELGVGVAEVPLRRGGFIGVREVRVAGVRVR